MSQNSQDAYSPLAILVTNCCESCVHWIPPSPNPTTEIVEWEKKHGACLMTNLNRSAELPATQATAVDGSDYFAILRTLPTFFCSQYERAPLGHNAPNYEKWRYGIA